MPQDPQTIALTALTAVSTAVQVISVMVGVVLSVKSFNATRIKEAQARELEAAKPFYLLRQSLYAEAIKAAATLSLPDSHTQEELDQARKRFRQLYIAELSMVEAPGVEAQMVELARQVDPELLQFTPAQSATYRLAHALRDTFTHWWTQGRE